LATARSSISGPISTPGCAPGPTVSAATRGTSAASNRAAIACCPRWSSRSSCRSGRWRAHAAALEHALFLRDVRERARGDVHVRGVHHDVVLGDQRWPLVTPPGVRSARTRARARATASPRRRARVAELDVEAQRSGCRRCCRRSRRGRTRVSGRGKYTQWTPLGALAVEAEVEDEHLVPGEVLGVVGEAARRRELREGMPRRRGARSGSRASWCAPPAPRDRRDHALAERDGALLDRARERLHVLDGAARGVGERRVVRRVVASRMLRTMSVRSACGKKRPIASTSSVARSHA
jgi:hypothetical protein